MSDPQDIGAARTAWETYISGKYRHLIQDAAIWDSKYARSLPQRALAEEIAARPAPSAEDFAAAEAMIKPAPPAYNEMLGVNPVESVPFVFTLLWWMTVLPPTLAAAVIARRGLIARAFKVDYVTRRGVPAPRWRLLLRVIVSQGPIIILPIVFFLVGSVVKETLKANGVELGDYIRWMNLFAIVLVVPLTIWSSLLTHRGLSDHLVGTYPVPE
jgi:hypothetical protein